MSVPTGDFEYGQTNPILMSRDCVDVVVCADAVAARATGEIIITAIIKANILLFMHYVLSFFSALYQ
jgi:hypothetical protein